MKKALLTILVALFCMVGFAQTDQVEHMKFKGIPMTGTQMSFVNKLKAKGYTYVGIKNGIAFLQGEFATVKDCLILVAKFADKDIVSNVGVIFPERKTWGDITKDYYSFKDLLTEKYGTPQCVEEFSDREPGDDFLRFHALLGDECQYLSEFTCENGKIQLSMKKMDYNTASTYIKYIDNSNAEELHKKILDDL